MTADKGQFDYSVIIPAYNEEVELGQTLASIAQAQEYCSVYKGEVIVVNNASTDRTEEIAKHAGAKVVFESERKISRVRNAGADAADGKYLVFLDADTVMEPKLLAEALDTLKSGRACGGGCAVKYKGNISGFGRRLVKVWGFVSRRKRWAAGSFMFCLKSAFDEVGGFDESVYYSEEVILSEALKRWGRKNKMQFVILEQCVYTSPRKLEWFGRREIFFALLLAPLRRKNREKSGLWYDRPG